ncbi:MAG: CPBP family intramembrane metalloprotease [Candidatus Eremiobacteraeota bacterium]|nr:CPBP family intramembrane metalloprotease [Candidatus Eremiobacteraeota bacterium]
MNNSISTTSAGWPTHWPANSFRGGPTALLILAAIGAAILGGVIGVLIFFAAHRPRTMGPQFVVSAIWVQLLVEGAAVIVILIGLPAVSKRSLRELGFYAPRPWQLGVALLGAIAMVIVVEGGASLIQTLTHTKHEQSVVELFKQVIGQPSVMWLFAVFAIVLAPFMEEVIFRIFIFNVGLRWGGFWLGAIVSGLCFGAAHADPYVLIPLALGGMVLCGVYYRTGNAFCSMVSHGLFNAVTVFALIFAPQLAQ